MDAVYLILGLAFFASCAGLVRLFDRLAEH